MFNRHHHAIIAVLSVHSAPLTEPHVVFRIFLTIYHRLDNDFIVFRGEDHESSGQQLKGTVVLCLPTSLRIEDVHLRLTGTLRMR
jgi:hypothetical protein